MISFRTLALSLLCTLLVSSAAGAQDLSKYRNFEFGMSIESVAKIANIDPSNARTIHRRPELIQAFDWDLRQYLQPAAMRDSIQSIRFDFYNGRLSKMVVSYDTIETEGLTVDDLIETVSALYGAATKPETSIVVSGSSVSENTANVLARWENAQNSYSLVRSPFGTAFGLVALSKELDAMASAANREADRLDSLEAPARESARLKKEQEERQSAQEKARLISKPKFRP